MNEDLRIWSEPVQPPAGFPEPKPGMFYGVLGEVVEAARPLTEADPVGILGCLLAEASALLGDGPTLTVSGMSSPTRLFVMLVGPTAKGRKGTAGDVARRIISASGVVRPDTLLQRGFASGEGVVEKLAELDDRRVFFRQDEMAGLLVAMNRDGSTLSSVVRDLWDGVPLAHTTAAGHTQVDDAHVSILGHVTPDELALRMRPVDFANGLANRFLPLAVHRRQLLVWDGEREFEEYFAEPASRLGTALSEGMAQRRYRLSPAAFKRWTEIYKTAPKSQMVAARREPQLLRLALIYAVLDGADKVDVCHLEAALSFWDYVVESLSWIFPAQAHEGWPPRAAEILRIVRGAGESGLSLEELGRRFSGHLGVGVRDTAVEFLAESGEVTRFKVQTPGRPKFTLVASCFVKSEEDAA